MAASGDLIDFDVIEEHKENIQPLPGGRSAKKLAELYSPSPLDKLSTPTPSDTRNVNDCIRAEYEAEVRNMSELDDPLDVFDRYVRWTLDAYPSAQATPQSQLHTLLERATKAFVSSAQYKNDPRYLKLWVHYIHLFSDAPREAYVFLSRHGIGEGLALFYEEYAAWLEAAGRWPQAEEVYKMGIERGARPVQRLLRKFKEFEERRSQQPEAAEAAAPSSPALPTMRPALAAKTEPFGSSSRPADPQAPRQGSGIGAAASRPAKSKLAVFSDADAQPSALSSRGEGSKGWDTIGSLADRKKENTQEPKPWVGEKLKAGGKRNAVPKMTVFRDSSLAQISNVNVVPSKNQVTVHPQTGKKEVIFVDLAAIYPTPEEPGTEVSFEEIMAANRGWLGCVWDEELAGEQAGEQAVPEPDRQVEETGNGVVGELAARPGADGVVYDENGAVMEPPREPRVGKKKKVMEVNETQIIKAKLDSPSGPKLRKKGASEPTMTLHTKAATDDIYEIFNAPLKSGARGDAESADEEDYETDGDYTTDAESTGTATRHVDGASEHGDDETCDAKSVSEWSDFSTRRHIPSLGADEEQDKEQEKEQDEPDGTLTSGLDRASATGPESKQRSSVTRDSSSDGGEDEKSERPAAEESPSPPRTVFIPLPPDDYDLPTRPYRDPAEVANNRLPFMTPITERTECSLDVKVDQCKTPCQRDDGSSPGPLSLGALSSPLREIAAAAAADDDDDDDGGGGEPEGRVAAPAAAKAGAAKGASRPRPAKGPIIKDKQCNPVDDGIRQEILAHAQPPLASYAGFYDHSQDRSGRGGEMRKFAKAVGKADRAAAPAPEAVVLQFPETAAAYRLKRELGAGAFAPVYLVENSAPEGSDDGPGRAVMGRGAFAVRQRSRLEAIKTESPPTAWEFYMMRLAHGRVGAQHRAAASLSAAHELHLYRDEAFLVLPFHAHGTLLDAVNAFRGEPSGVMDEALAMVFAVELLRTVEALHARGLVHGDVKADNCLLRLAPDQPLAAPWRADGGGGWAARGLVLIDFGRAIDMAAFAADVEFVADWKTSAHDCAEMREGRPWTWQIDYHGLAGTLHCLLFGKYMDTARCDDGGLGRAGRRYRIRETLKRYWQTDLWADCFELLLNPLCFVDAEAGARMPVLRSMRRVRERMEAWLEANGERGVGLRSLVAKLEAHARSRR